MKFLVDECCSANLVEKIRKSGYDVLYVKEEDPGITDTEVLKRALEEKRILITEDKDFGELVYRLQKEVHGIILLRFGVSEQDKKWSRLKVLLRESPEKLSHYFVVVDIHKFRFRRL